MMDAILSPEWQYRYFSFNRHWAAGERMASLRNGSGDDWHIVFRDSLVFFKSFERAHRRIDSGGVPQAFARELAEPAFSISEMTFCGWWMDGDWQDRGTPSPYLFLLDGRPETYQGWAEDYFETDVPLEAVTQFYSQAPLTEAMVQALSKDVVLQNLLEDVEEIGYPTKT